MSRRSLTDGFLASFVEGAMRGAAERILHRPTVHTDPAVIAAWAEWQPPDQWAAEHERNAL